MARKRQTPAPEAPSSGLPGVHFLDALASIPINETTASTAGVLRATFDGISADLDVARAREAARARGPEALAEFTGAVARLAARTAAYHASLK